MEVEVSCHYIRRVRLSDVPLQQCGQQHPFRAVLPLGGDIVLGALNVALTEKMTCFSVWICTSAGHGQPADCLCFLPKKETHWKPPLMALGS